MKRSAPLQRRTPLRATKPMRRRSPRAKAGSDREYLAFIRRLPCVVTGQVPAEASHLRSLKHGSGLGLKSPDRTAIPMSREVHRQYETRSGIFRNWTQEQREEWHLRHATAYGRLFEAWKARGAL